MTSNPSTLEADGGFQVRKPPDLQSKALPQKNKNKTKAFVEPLFHILLANDLKLRFDYNCKVKSSLPILQFRPKTMCSVYKTR